MAVRTASVAGNWSNTATWGGAAVPGNGDSAILNVAVVVDVDTTVGASGASGTEAIGISSPNGKLTIGDGITLRVRGDLNVSGANTASNHRLLMGPGSQIIFDATLASGAQYQLVMGSGHFQAPMLYVRGTSGSPASISSDVTGGALPAYAGGENIGQGQIDAEYLNFTRFGDAANPSWKVWGGNQDHYIRMNHVNFNFCGQFDTISNFTGGTTFIMEWVKYTNTVNTDFCGKYASNSGITGSGVRRVKWCSYDKKVNFFGPNGFTIEYCVFQNVWGFQNHPWASFQKNFFRDVSQESFSAGGNVTDCYYLDDTPVGNPHGMGSPVDVAQTWQGIIIEPCNAAGGGGDFLFPINTSSPRVTTIKRCILLPTEGLAGGYGKASGKLVSMLGGANTTAVVEHNTYVVSDDAETGVQVGETYGGHAGMVSSFKSNLAWKANAGSAGYKFIRIAGSVQNPVAPANANYNWGWNLSDGSAGNGYHGVGGTALFTGGTPGANDGNGDPQFVDSTRNLAKWAVATQGSVSGTAAGQRADGITALMNDPTKIDSLLDYVRIGFTPKNALMEAVGHDGLTPGAVQFDPLLTDPPEPGPGEPNEVYAEEQFSGEFNTEVSSLPGWERGVFPVDGSFNNYFRLSGDGTAFATVSGYRHVMMYATGVPTGDEYDVRAKVVILSAASGTSFDKRIGIVFKGGTGDTYWLCQYETYWGRWSLALVTAGSVSNESQWSDSFASGPFPKVRNVEIRVRDGLTTVRFDGVERLSSANATVPGNRFGIYATGDSGFTEETGFHFDAFSAGSPGFTLPTYGVKGPDIGPPDFDSSDFTASLINDSNPGSITITPAVTGITGTFTPTTVTLTNAVRTGTFIFRPTSQGTATISFTNTFDEQDAADMTYESVYAGPTRESAWAEFMKQYTIDFPYVAGATEADGTGGYSLDNPGTEHYDPVQGAYNWQDYAVRKGLSKTDYSSDVAAGIVRLRNRAILAIGSPGTPPNQETPGVPQYHRHITGMGTHYYHTSDPLDRDAFDVSASLTEFTQYSLNDFIEAHSHIGVQREMAFWLQSVVDRAWMGMGEHPYLNASVTILLNHIAQWTATPQRFGIWMKPWMAALNVKALVNFWDRYRDSAEPAKVTLCNQIPPAIKSLAAFIWDTAWYPTGISAGADFGPWDKGAIAYVDKGPTHPDIAPITGVSIVSVSNPTRVFRGPNTLSAIDGYYIGAAISITGSGDFNTVSGYIGSTREFTISSTYPLQTPITTANTFSINSNSYNFDEDRGPAPGLNNMVSPIYAWCYWHERRVLGNFEASKHYRTKFHQMFNGSIYVWGIPDKKKSWNQEALWTCAGLFWAERGDSEWAQATSFSLQAPSTGLLGDSGVRSGAFRLAIPVGSRLALPEALTPTTDIGDGTFSSPGPILTSDKPIALMTYIPGAGDDGQTVAISAIGETLDPADPVDYVVGDPEEPPVEPEDTVTAFSFTGPTSGEVFQPSSLFTVTLGSGDISGTVRITFAGTGGSFSPPYVDLTNVTRYGTTVFQPSTQGARTLTAADNRGLTDPAGISFTGTPPVATGGDAQTFPGDTVVMLAGGILIIPWDGKK